MSKIVYFCTPDRGHFEPTLSVVHALIRRGHEVIYYAFDEFREEIENTGASYVSCDAFLEPLELTPKQVLSLSTNITDSFPKLADITLAMDPVLCEAFTASRPDCIIADTHAIWGKSIAIKMKIPYVCSMTCFAMNRYSSRLMRTTPSKKFLHSISKSISLLSLRKLQENGYPIQNMEVLLPDDGVSTTLVYSSRGFHPASETFSDNYHFIGFQIYNDESVPIEREQHKLIYVSMGSLNNMKDFYRTCVEAFRGQNINVVMSTGRGFPPTELGVLPGNIFVRSWVDQKVALQNADLFICHSGMSSVNESLYYGVPMLLFPQTVEQRGISKRVVELKCGTVLHKDDMITMRNAAKNILENDSFCRNAEWVSGSLRQKGGIEEAIGVIEGEIAKDDVRRRQLAEIAFKKQAARDLEEAKVLARSVLLREKAESEIDQELKMATQSLAESVREIESRNKTGVFSTDTGRISSEEIMEQLKHSSPETKIFDSQNVLSSGNESTPAMPFDALQRLTESSFSEQEAAISDIQENETTASDTDDNTSGFDMNDTASELKSDGTASELRSDGTASELRSDRNNTELRSDDSISGFGAHDNNSGFRLDDNSSGAHPYHAGVSDPGTDAASEKAGNTHTENKSRKKHDETKAGKNKKKKKDEKTDKTGKSTGKPTGKSNEKSSEKKKSADNISPGSVSSEIVKKKKKKKNKDSEKPKKQKIRRKVNIEDPDRFKAAVIKDMKDAFWNKRYDDEE